MRFLRYPRCGDDGTCRFGVLDVCDPFKKNLSATERVDPGACVITLLDAIGSLLRAGSLHAYCFVAKVPTLSCQECKKKQAGSSQTPCSHP